MWGAQSGHSSALARRLDQRGRGRALAQAEDARLQLLCSAHLRGSKPVSQIFSLPGIKDLALA